MCGSMVVIRRNVYHVVPLGTEVDISPHCITRGPSSPRQRGTAAPALFSAHVYYGQTVAHLSYCRALIMVALCNRADHYIFILFLLSSSFFPRLISAFGDWMFTILWHMVWP